MKEEREKIAILGCGWLGLPLAKSLLSKGYEVKGSTTSESKLEVLKNAGISPFQIQLEEHQVIGTIEDFLKETDVLVIDIPPGLRREISSTQEMTFVNKIKTLIPFIEKSGIQKVIFVSSTSVYSDGFPIVEIREETKPNPDTESGKQLVIAETLLQSNSHFKTTVIRLGGLLGDDRHPIKFLGDVGRPDLAQKAADMTQEQLAAMLYESLMNKIMPLPNEVMVYPAHGAGSACGKNMMKETMDSLGHQKEMNYALNQPSKEAFIEAVLDGLLPPPAYFPMNVAMNKRGIAPLMMC